MIHPYHLRIEGRDEFLCGLPFDVNKGFEIDRDFCCMKCVTVHFELFKIVAIIGDDDLYPEKSIQ